MRVSGTKRWIAAITLASATLLSMTAASAGERTPEPVPVTPALFEGQIINIAQDWGEATACMVSDLETLPECFRTEAEMDAQVGGIASVTGASSGALSPLAAQPGPGVTLNGTNCSASLRLYNGTSYTGSILWLNVRHSWLNLANYGFNQRTSSFKIGSCSSYFADYSNGGGAWYPTGSTQAYDVSSSMISGWNNDVSSVYIN